METDDFLIARTPRNALLRLVGHVHRAEFDVESQSNVRAANATLTRLLSLFGSGLLRADAPNTVPQVASTIRELVESNAASHAFDWESVSTSNLASCALHFIHNALNSESAPDVGAAAVATDLLERAPDANLSDADASESLYLARLLRHTPVDAQLPEHDSENLSIRLGSAVEQAAPDGESVEIELWRRGPLFNLAHSRSLLAIDTNRMVPSTEGAVATGTELAAAYAAEIPPHACAFALILCGAVDVVHRLAGVRVVYALANAASIDAALGCHWDACLRALQDALALPHPHVLAHVVHCLRHLVDAMPDSSASNATLAAPDPRREVATDTLIDALLQAAIETGESGAAFGAVAACSLRVAVSVSGLGHALLARSAEFADLFASLYLRAARGQLILEENESTYIWNLFSNSETGTDKMTDDPLDALVAAFDNAVRVAWPRLGAHRKAVVQACMVAVLETRSLPRKRKDSVFVASQTVLRALLRCDGAERTVSLLEALREKAARYPSLKDAKQLFESTIQEHSVNKSSGRETSKREKYGRLAHIYFENGIETPVP